MRQHGAGTWNTPETFKSGSPQVLYDPGDVGLEPLPVKNIEDEGMSTRLNQATLDTYNRVMEVALWVAPVILLATWLCWTILFRKHSRVREGRDLV